MLILAVRISGSAQSIDCTATAFSPTAVLLTWNSGNIQEIEHTENFTVRESGNCFFSFYLFFLHFFILITSHLYCFTRFEDEDATCSIKYQVTRINGEGRT